MIPPRQPPGTAAPGGVHLPATAGPPCGCPAGAHRLGCLGAVATTADTLPSGPVLPQHGAPKHPRDRQGTTLRHGQRVQLLHNATEGTVIDLHPHHLRPEVTVRVAGARDLATGLHAQPVQRRYAGTMVEVLP